MSQKRRVLSSELEMRTSMRGWNMTQDTLLVWPLRVSISQCLLPERRQSFIVLSSAQDAIIFMEGWNVTQFTPFSWPSRMCLTSTSVPPKSSPGLEPYLFMTFSLSLKKSQTRTVISREQLAMRVSSEWKVAHMT